MVVGFCNGDFHRLHTDELDRFSRAISQKFFNSGANLIELMIRDENTLDHLLAMDRGAYDIFTYRSIHAPVYAYDDSETSHRLIDKIAKVYERFGMGHVIFHTDTVRSWKVVTKNKNVLVAIENMDEQKISGQSVEDIAVIIDHYPVSLVIDLQHCFVNDNSMQLAHDLHERFRDRIVGYHISGYHERFLHYPLFKTGQDRIIDSLELVDIPITIESTFDAYDEAKKELKYIIERINT